jgi:hypothetical protein
MKKEVDNGTLLDIVDIQNLMAIFFSIWSNGLNYKMRSIYSGSHAMFLICVLPQAFLALYRFPLPAYGNVS